MHTGKTYMNTHHNLKTTNTHNYMHTFLGGSTFSCAESASLFGAFLLLRSSRIICSASTCPYKQDRRINYLALIDKIKITQGRLTVQQTVFWGK